MPQPASEKRHIRKIRRSLGLREKDKKECGPCPICKKMTGAAGATCMRQWAVDHDHGTGAFRGWICGSCNSSIGKLGDDVEGLVSALRYLLGYDPFPFGLPRPERRPQSIYTFVNYNVLK